MTDLEARVAALEAQVRQLSDELAIRRIISRYGPLVDSTTDAERLRKVADFFGESGIYDLGEEAKFNGSAFAETLAHPPHQDYIAAGSTHVMSMPYVLVDGDRATALGYSHLFQNSHDGDFKVLRGSANYWEFERRDDGWRLVRRTNRLMDGTEEPRRLLHHVDETSPAR